MVKISIKSSAAARLKEGYPWVHTPNLASSKPLTVAPGSIVTLTDEMHTPFATAYLNPLTKIVGRVLTCSLTETIDVGFFYTRFKQAHQRRERFFNVPFYRLVHAESDHLPGLIIDRFGDTFVCQTNTAGMERLKPLWLEALVNVFNPNRVIFKDSSESRTREGLELSTTAPIGQLEGLIEILENDFSYFANPTGQKTGWFYDHRANRLWVAQRSKKCRVLDLYTYQGGFGLLALKHGANHVTLVDSSETALAITRETAERSALKNYDLIQSDVFDLLENLIRDKAQFDVVIADPPAFVKQAHHKSSGLRGYQKLARLTSQLVSPEGMLFIASCSHHAQSNEFRQAVERGLNQTSRAYRLLRKAGADKDHPIHPFLPETHYLKSLAYRFI